MIWTILFFFSSPLGSSSFLNIVAEHMFATIFGYIFFTSDFGSVFLSLRRKKENGFLLVYSRIYTYFYGWWTIYLSKRCSESEVSPNSEPTDISCSSRNNSTTYYRPYWLCLRFDMVLLLNHNSAFGTQIVMGISNIIYWFSIPFLWFTEPHFARFLCLC